MQCPNCSSTLDVLETPTPSFCSQCNFPILRLEGRYRLERVLDEGGFGIVYLATDLHTPNNPLRAIKFLKPVVVSSRGGKERFQKEVHLTATLSRRTPHVVFTYDSAGYDEVMGFYYVMEFLQGVSLRYLLRNSYLNFSSVRTILEQLVRVLHFVHENNVVHRDLKPSNIFLVHDEEGHGHGNHFVKLLDFGIAKQLEETSQEALTRGAIGSPEYMSPEQCTGGEVTPQADQYALATILYEMLTGHHPLFQKNARAQMDMMRQLSLLLQKKPTPARHYNARLQRQVDEALQKALSKKPQDRFSDIPTFWNALSPYLQERRLSQDSLPQPHAWDLYAPVELQPKTFWIGSPSTGESPQSNACLRMYEEEDENGRLSTFSVLINPGALPHTSTLHTRLTSTLTSPDKLSAIYLSSASPEVASALSGLLNRRHQSTKLLCSEKTWYQLQSYQLPLKTFVPLGAFSRGFRTPTGAVLTPFPAPFCPSAGSSLLYDNQTGVLYSGLLFSQFGQHREQSLWAEEKDWSAMETWHRMYIPSTERLQKVLDRLEGILDKITLIVPQQGGILRQSMVTWFFEKLRCLELSDVGSRP